MLASQVRTCGLASTSRPATAPATFLPRHITSRVHSRTASRSSSISRALAVAPPPLPTIVPSIASFVDVDAVVPSGPHSNLVPELSSPEAFTDFVCQEGLSLVAFTTPWCGPCKLVAKELDVLMKAFKHVRYAKVDVAKADPDFATRQRIKSLPTLRVYRNGACLDECTGVKPVAMRQMLLNASLSRAR